MTVTVASIFLIDGREYQVSVEAGSAKEGVALVLQAAEEAGAAPANGGAAAPKRTRRIKAEIEADEKAKAAQAAQSLPPGTVYAFSGAAPAPDPRVRATDDPPVPLGHSEVSASGPPASFGAPPPPPYAPPTQEQVRRHAARAAVDDLRRSVPEGWVKGVDSAVGQIVAKHGGNIDAMSIAQLDAFVADVAKYRAACDAAPR